MDSNGGWLEDAMAINAIALAWYSIFSGQTPPPAQGQPTASVHTPAGSASVSISPIALLFGAGLVIYLVAR